MTDLEIIGVSSMFLQCEGSKVNHHRKYLKALTSRTYTIVTQF